MFGHSDLDEKYPELKRDITFLDVFVFTSCIAGVAIFALPYIIQFLKS